MRISCVNDRHHLSRLASASASASASFLVVGFVVLFGSNLNNQILADIAVDVDLDLLVWESRADLLLGGRHHPITFANDTHGFVLSGSTLESSYTSDFLVYEEATDTWKDLSNTDSAFPGMARSLGYGVAATLDCDNTKAYLGFGAAESGQRLTDLWEFDMSTHKWRSLADFPGDGRRHPAMTFVEPVGEIHVGMGDGNEGNYNDWWSYNIANDEWSQLPGFPSSQRHHPFSFSIDSDSYVGFGHSTGYDPYIERDWYKYDTLEGKWNREADFVSYALEVNSTVTISSENSTNIEAAERNHVLSPVTTEARVAGTQFTVTDSCDGNQTFGFILSGDGNDHGHMPTGEFHVFDPRSKDEYSTWHSLPPHPGFSRWAPGSFVLQGSTRVYMMGGYDREIGVLFADMWTMNLAPLFDDDNEITLSDIATNITTSPGVTNSSIIENNIIEDSDEDSDKEFGNEKYKPSDQMLPYTNSSTPGLNMSIRYCCWLLLVLVSSLSLVF